MKRLVSTIGLPKEEWLKYRKQGICGSDAGAIAGMNPYVSAFSVYQDKIAEKIKEIPDNEAMKQGRDLEEYVAKRFTEETGMRVKRANYIFQNEKYNWMLADFDRLIVGQKAGLECKTVSPYSAEKWKDGAVPLSYLLQVQHYLAVSGYECWYVAALIYGRDFVIRKIERDEETIRSLIKIEEHFWFERVKKKNPPEPDGSDDYTQMFEYGLNPKLIHRPATSDRGEPVYFYGLFKTQNGGYGYSCMSKEDMDSFARTYSKAFGSSYSPWQTNYEEMAKKTVIKQALKYAPISTEFQRALSTDETIKSKIAVDMTEAENEMDFSAHVA